MTRPPAFSCILTATTGEGPAARRTIASLLAQERGDFELLIVDDGADAATRAALHGLRDRRIRHVRMSRAGRATARNRALRLAQGTWLIALDPGDMLAGFALAQLAAQADTAQCLFAPGVLRAPDGAARDGTGGGTGQGGTGQGSTGQYGARSTPGQRIFDWAEARGLARGTGNNPHDRLVLAALALLPPTGPLRAVRRDYALRHALCCANGLSGGEVLFQVAALLNLGEFALVPLPLLARDTGPVARRPVSGTGLTDVAGLTDTAPVDLTADTAFDALGVAAQVLALFERARHFFDPQVRLALMAGLARLLMQAEAALEPDRRDGLRNGIRLLALRSEPCLRRMLEPAQRAGPEAALGALVPWITPVLDHVTPLWQAPTT